MNRRGRIKSEPQQEKRCRKLSRSGIEEDTCPEEFLTRRNARCAVTILAQGAKRAAAHIWIYRQGERQSPGPKLVPAPEASLDIQTPAPGLRPESTTRRSVEQGPRLRGCDRAGVCKSRAIRRSHVPRRGRIQAHNAWNLLRPARDTLSASLVVFQILSCAVLRVIVDSGTQRTRVSLC